MSAHFEAVEADFQSHYGLDLREVLWGKTAAGVRRILALVRGLPARSATARTISAAGRDWSSTEELLASLIEMTDLTNRLLHGAFTKKGTQSWKPIRVTRPTDLVRPKLATAAEVRRFFGGHAKYEEGEA